MKIAITVFGMVPKRFEENKMRAGEIGQSLNFVQTKNYFLHIVTINTAMLFLMHDGTIVLSSLRRYRGHSYFTTFAIEPPYHYNNSQL
jgi:hypothetical protein